MRINKRSWHYRYVYWMDDCVPSTLCGYFWRLVLFGFMIPLLVLLVMGGFLGKLIMALIIQPVEIGCVLGGLSILVGLTGGSVWLYSKCTKSNNLFFSWLRAKKQKICPLIEFYEDNNK